MSGNHALTMNIPKYSRALHSLLLTVVIACPSYADEPDSLLGKPAPDLVLSALDGKSSMKLSDHVGKIVVLQFWATWVSTNYAPVANMQDIAARHENWAGKVELFTVCVDRDPAQAARVMTKQGWNQTKHMIVNIDKSADFGISVLPAAIIIAPDGTIATMADSHSIDGVTPETGRSLEDKISALLADNKVRTSHASNSTSATRGGGSPRIYEAVTDANGACRFVCKDREKYSDDDGYFTVTEVSAAGYVPCALPVGGLREVSWGRYQLDIF